MFRFFLIFIIALPVYSQVNIEEMRQLDTNQVSGMIGVTGMFQTGNVEQKNIGLNGNIAYRIDKREFMLITRGQYIIAENNQFSNDALLHLRNSNMLNNYFFQENYIQYNFNRLIKLDDRFVLGSGFRGKFFNNETFRFFLGLSVMFEHEDVDVRKEDIHPQSTSHFRMSNYISTRIKIKDDLTFATTNYYQPRIAHAYDYRLLSETALIVQVTENVRINIFFRMRTDSDPPDGLEKTDTNTSIGVSFTI